MTLGLLLLIIFGGLFWIYCNYMGYKSMISISDDFELPAFIAMISDLVLIGYGLYKLIEWLFTIKLW